MAGEITFSEVHGNKTAGTYVLKVDSAHNVEAILIRRTEGDKLCYSYCTFDITQYRIIASRDCTIAELGAVSTAMEGFVSPNVVTKTSGEMKFRSNSYRDEKWYVTNFGGDEEAFYCKSLVVTKVTDARRAIVEEKWGEKKPLDDPIVIMLFRATLGDQKFDRDLQWRPVKPAR